jgi:hypothetical protein
VIRVTGIIHHLKSMAMKTFFSTLLILVLASCQKNANTVSVLYDRPVFFENDREMMQTVQAALDQAALGEKLERVEHISYIDSKQKSYAFVFYQSNKGSNNVVIQKQYLPDNKVALSSVRCEGLDCNCQVKTIIDNNGGVSVDCSCSSCTMLVNSYTVTAN